MSSSFALTLQIILTVLAGISAQVLAAWLVLPGIVFLLVFGVLLGPSGLGWLHPAMLGDGLESIVALLVAIILFEGGFNLQLRDLGRVSKSLRNLVTIGTMVTLLGGGMAAHYLSEFPWPIAFLYAALVVVTGPTVVTSLLQQVKVDRSVSTLLESEGVLNDPVGAILAVVVLNVVLNGNLDPIALIADLALRVGVGAAIGITGGWSLGWFLKRATFLSEDLKTLVVLAAVWGLFGSAQLLRSEAGLMAMVTAGIMLRSSELPEERLLKRFKGQLTTLSVSVLFILLSADLSIPSLLALGWEGIWTVLAIMFIVRPVSILLCTWQSGLGWRQKIFLAWIAPRGIVSASVASLFAIVLTDQGINGGDSIKALVFLTIILTVFLQASTAQVVANVLRLNAADRKGLVIVGLNPVSVLITRLFLERGETIAIIDTEPDESDLRSLSEIELRSPEQLRILNSTAWDATVLEQAGLANAGTFLAITDNAEVNAVLAQRSIDEFSPPRVLAVFPRAAEASTIQTTIQPAFSSQSNLKLWNQYLQDNAVRLGQVDLDAALILELGRSVDQERMMPLLVERRNSLQQNSLQVVPGDWDWQAGDRLTYLLHEPKPQLMKLLSGTAQPKLLVEEAPGF